MPNKHFNLAAFKDGTAITPEYLEAFSTGIAEMILTVLNRVEKESGREIVSMNFPVPGARLKDASPAVSIRFKEITESPKG